MKHKFLAGLSTLTIAVSISGAAHATPFDVSSLIHLWSGENNINDSVGSANGTLGSNTAFGAGINGTTAFSFDGSDNAVASVPVNISPSVFPRMTMGMYINVQSITNTRGWVMGQDNGGYDRALMISDDRFGSGLSAGVGHTYASSLTNLGNNLDEWYGIAVAYDQTTASATVYINDLLGNSQTQVISTSLGNGLSNATFGGLQMFGGHGVNALVDDVFIYDRTLSQAELDRVFAVPEPTILFLFGAGLAGLAGMRRNKKF